ncbi:hypothetical protein AGDE_14074 [Angomonas deanei]|nr:hypothetical protein AGDE_14074 [Angomonas deanei]|eukprot:EPY21460.1 hypothetical protein AGDE_14074 [Angomonas deanei]
MHQVTSSKNETAVSLKNKKRQLEEIKNRISTLEKEIAEGEEKQTVLLSVHGSFDEQLKNHQNFFPGRTVEPFADTLGKTEWVTSDCGTLFLDQARILSHPLYQVENHDEVEEFLRSFAPLFAWDREHCTIQNPFTYDQPCLLEMECGTCCDRHCKYWHANPVANANRWMVESIHACRAHFSRDTRRCVLSSLLEDFLLVISSRSTLSEWINCVKYYLRYIISAGWHTILLKGCVHTPLVGVADHDETLDESVLRHPLERMAWSNVLIGRGKIALSATRLFEEQPNAVSWRCMLRACSSTPEERLWLVQKGLALFPVSPHMHLHYIVALMNMNCAIHTLLEACRTSCSLLASQSIAATVSLVETNYAFLAPRYIAYMLATVLLYIARVDNARASELISSITTQNGAGFALLPVAVQNFHFLHLVLQQHHSLAPAEHLPLTAISDTVFVLLKPVNHPSKTATDMLSQQYLLIQHCQKSGYDADALDAMSAGVNVTMTRLFSCEKFSQIEAMMEKLAIASPMSQAVLWIECGNLCHLFSGHGFADSFWLELSTKCTSQLFLLLQVTSLFRFGKPLDFNQSFAQACHHFEQDTQTQPRELSDAPLRQLVEMRGAVEVTCYFILRACQCADLETQLNSIRDIPMTVIAGDPDATTVWAFALLSVAARRKDLDAFRDGLEKFLLLLREGHFQWWSPLDTYYTSLIGLPHFAVLQVYQKVPLLLGSAAALTAVWRKCVLEVGSRLGVLHPLLRASPGTAADMQMGNH